MYKQKQLLWRSNKRRGICNLLDDKNRRKKLQILETYIVSPQKSRSNSVFEFVQKDKLQALRKKQSDRYFLINPKSKYSRKVHTQLSDHQDEYLQELKSLKTQLKDIQKDIGDRKAKQQEEQYMSEIKNIKSEIINLKNIQKDVEDKKFLEEYFVDDISIMRDEIRQLQKQVLQKRSPHYLPLIHSHPFSKANPQNFSVPTKQSFKRRYNKNIRSDSVYIESQNQLKQLREEVRQLRSDIVSRKKPYPNNQIDSASMRGTKHLPPVQLSNSQLNDRSSLKLGSIYVANPRANKQQRSNSYVGQRMWKKKVHEQALRKFKRAVNAILFIHRLQRFSQRIRLKRQNFFKQSFQDNIYNRVKLVKDVYLKSTLEFVNSLPITEQLSLVIVSSDTEVQRTNKVGWTRKYLNRFFDLIKETQFVPSAMQSLTETCYFVCRHGSAGVLSNYFTAEQLDIMCVSKAQLKVLAEKNLEKSQIISFIWVKLIIFNILFRTDTTKQLKLQNNPAWNANFCLFGSLIYEICRKIQAQLIEKTPINYVIGNWKHLNFINTKNSLSRKTINPSKSMTIDLKQYEKTFPSENISTQLVQGTVSKKFLLQAYEYENWQPQERRILNYIQLIHRRICKYHAQLKDQLL